MSSASRSSTRSSAIGPSGGASSRARRATTTAEVITAPARPVLAAPWTACAVEPDGPAVELVQRWMVAPHVARHWHQAWDLATWSAEIAAQLAGDHSRPWLVAFAGEAVAYVELYRVALDVLADAVPVDPDDVGIHVAIGDVSRTGRGLGPRVLDAVAEGVLRAEPACRRVLGDPDVGHDVARRAFAAAGFEPVAEVDLPHKRAAVVARCRP